MKKYSHTTFETRWIFDEEIKLPRKEIRHGIVYTEQRFKWDLFHWFDTKTTDWGRWVDAPDRLTREMK